MVFDKLQKNDMIVNMQKIQFAENDIKLLVVMVNGNDIKPLQVQQEKLSLTETPSNIKETRAFIGSMY